MLYNFCELGKTILKQILIFIRIAQNASIVHSKPFLRHFWGVD